LKNAINKFFYFLFEVEQLQEELRIEKEMVSFKTNLAHFHFNCIILSFHVPDCELGRRTQKSFTGSRQTERFLGRGFLAVLDIFSASFDILFFNFLLVIKYFYYYISLTYKPFISRLQTMEGEKEKLTRLLHITQAKLDQAVSKLEMVALPASRKKSNTSAVNKRAVRCLYCRSLQPAINTWLPLSDENAGKPTPRRNCGKQALIGGKSATPKSY
jgi:hypothetical protein